MYCVYYNYNKEISRQFAPKLMRPSRGSSAPIDPLFLCLWYYDIAILQSIFEFMSTRLAV